MVYSFKSGVNELKAFRNYLMQWKLFQDIRSDDRNPKEVWKIKQGLN